VLSVVVMVIVEKEIKVKLESFFLQKKTILSLNSGQTTVQVPQPIFVHTGPAGYQPQYNRQYAPQTWSPVEVRSIESCPMLPRPSAPPQPNDHFQIEHPPPSYEKLYKNK
jgi:hypothetical protein